MRKNPKKLLKKYPKEIFEAAEPSHTGDYEQPVSQPTRQFETNKSNASVVKAESWHCRAVESSDVGKRIEEKSVSDLVDINVRTTNSGLVTGFC